jgi:ubiquinone/menaquinone biosynthesis C-methylase UbiE
MATPQKPVSNEITYFLDAENAAEMARLMRQDRDFTQALGGTLPEIQDLASIHDVLDIACGPGGWAFELARTQPHMRVTGFDISHLMIEYASMQAQRQGFNNLRFLEHDALQPLPFPDNSFDIVNARLIFGFMPATAWPRLLRECVRVARPGGRIRLNEYEVSVSNGIYSERMSALYTEALRRAGKSFSPDGRHIAVLPMLGRLLRDVDCRNIQNRANIFDLSAGTEGHTHGYDNFMVLYKLVQPMLVKTGVATQNEVDVLYQQVMEEMQQDHYCAVIFYATFWGEVVK